MDEDIPFGQGLGFPAEAHAMEISVLYQVVEQHDLDGETAYTR
ncbi:hypothetical protein [Castellaniella sp. GW247-6E4]